MSKRLVSLIPNRSFYLQIERDTFGKLQCHPYPHEYVDTSKQCAHCAFFMGLQRKQGEIIQEGQQFDIRGTVDEFRQSVNMYMFWKPGMEIYVSHVRRKQIPSYVFPDGYKRSRPSRLTAQQQANEYGEVGGTGSSERCLKRKNDSGEVDLKQGMPEKRRSISPQRQDSVSPEIISNKFSSVSRGHMASHLVGNNAIAERDRTWQVDNGKVEGLASNGLSAGTGSVRQELRWMEGDKELAESQKGMLCPETEAACGSNSIIITTLASEGSSCEDAGFGSMVGSSEGNTGSVEESMDGGNNLGSSLGDLCEAHSVLPSENERVNCSEVLQDGSQEELEVLDLSSFTYLDFP